MSSFSDEPAIMRRAIELAAGGFGAVEPNPPVGAVIVDAQGRLLGEGRHERFGGPHAEINALKNVSGSARGATLFVTLEPCCHTGKTPPCTNAILDAGISRVVVGALDPAPHASGRGVDQLKAAGVDVEVGLLEDEAARLIAPFRKLMTQGLPWVHAKWAMTLDGHIAARTGHSQWISNEQSRAIVHRLRGRVDAVIIGARTAEIDNPLLTARPPGPRLARRIVLDGGADLEITSQLVQTAREFPLLVVCTPQAPQENRNRLREAGAEVLECAAAGERIDLACLLSELGRRQMTHVLVEGGSELLGAFVDQDLIDEVHVFIAPKIVGGTGAIPAIGGLGRERVAQEPQLSRITIEQLGGDLYVHGDIIHEPPATT